VTAASNPHDGRRDPATPAADMPAVSATSNPPTGDRRTTAAAPAPGLSFMSSPAVELERSPVRALPRRDANVSLVGPDGLAPTWLLHVGPGVVRLAPRPRPRHEGRRGGRGGGRRAPRGSGALAHASGKRSGSGRGVGRDAVGRAWCSGLPSWTTGPCGRKRWASTAHRPWSL
jgi:hypothetical protein